MRGAKLDESPVIFVVDDDESVRTAVRRLLLALHLPIRLFGSAEQFLSEIDRGACGCLVLDLKLPGMSGLQLQQEMVASHWKMPVVRQAPWPGAGSPSSLAHGLL